ncbi:MAG TPA: tyrosine-type recombinase/integrase [Ktedonobacteraceae bacterium]|jgi:site-specific recombinase XerD|nr:tyrosine-type recombinase/integrase [Ktedonobacteraceae bacterium]
MSQSLDTTDFSASLQNATGQLSKRSKRIYENDAKVFAKWLLDYNLIPDVFSRSHAIAYRAYLEETYQKATAKRMLSVARRIFAEQVMSGKRSDNPFQDVKGFTVANETTHTALTKEQAKELLDAIDQSTLIGKRDYALVSLLLRTGIRRSECAALDIGDLQNEQGHTIAVIRHGKGDKRRIIKIPVDVFRSIQVYIKSVDRVRDPLDAPLFAGFDRWLRSTGERISDKLIERTVKYYGRLIGVPKLTPHGLRATFITLALEAGATLLQVQYAAGHDDPRTTERYQTRKLNLDDNAVDKLAFLSRE